MSANDRPERGYRSAQHEGTAVRLHVESVGAGPPLVLLHGWGLHSGIFAPLLPALAERNRVHAIDLPGHGHSAPVVPYDLHGVVAAVQACIDAVAAEPVTLLGWSFGGMLAQRIAFLEPTRVARLVLVCTTPRFVSAGDWPHAVAARVLEQFADELTVAYDVTIRRFLTLQMRDVTDARATLNVMRAQLAARPRADAAALAGALAILESADLRGDASALAMPALVVTGSRDALTPPGAGAWLAATLPHATLAAIAAAAHIPFLSHRAAFDAALADFLDARAAA